MRALENRPLVLQLPRLLRILIFLYSTISMHDSLVNPPKIIRESSTQVSVGGWNGQDGLNQARWYPE